MENFLVAAAAAVGGAVVQEAVSRAVSMVLGKRKEKASQGQYLERLGTAVKEVDSVLERTAKMPITDVSLLRDRIELKRDFFKAAYLLSSRNKKRQAREGQEGISQGLVARPSIFSASSLIGMTKDNELCLSCDDIERFEQFANVARNILTRVESGCSLRRYMFFPCPLVRHLFDARKILIYRMVQADEERNFELWPGCFEEECGVELWVRYKYVCRRRPDKSFSLGLVLRLSESTDIVGITIKCLQSLAPQFNIVADTAIGELTLIANLRDVCHSHAPPWVGMQEWQSELAQLYRPDPLCCTSEGRGPFANNVVSSELSHVLPEEVTLFSFSYYISAPKYNLRSSSTDEAGKRSVVRNRRPPLQLTVSLAPHYVHDEELQSSYAAELIGDNDEEERIDVISIRQAGETVRSRATDCFLRQPKVPRYKLAWGTKHGCVYFSVENPRAHVPKISGMSKS